MDFVGIDKFSLLDYDGYVSVVLFAPTCNFRCPFCHNGTSVLNSNSSIKFDDILSFLKSRKELIDAVVITGGEPTLMNDLVDKIVAIRNLGFKIKLDTNGTNPETLSYLINNKLIDYVAMDIKNSFDKYCLTSGVKSINLDNISKSISLIMSSGIDYEFRTTLVEEFHTSKDMLEIAKLLQGSKRYFLQKFVDREGVIDHSLHEVSFKQATEFKEILSKYVDFCELRGY